MIGMGKIAAPHMPSMHLPHVQLGSVRMPKISLSSVPVPKIKAIHLQPTDNGGWGAKHVMSGGGRPKQFVFSSPAKMLTHLKRIEKNQWLKPMQDTAPALAHALDIGATP